MKNPSTFPRVRKQPLVSFQPTADQTATLKALSGRTYIPQSALMRLALGQFLARVQAGGPIDLEG